MAKRLRLPALVIAAIVTVILTVATASGADVLRSSSRSTVTPPPKPRVQKPNASALAQVKALQKQLAAARAKVQALKKALASAKSPAKKAELTKALHKAEANVKRLQSSLAKAKARACDTGYKLIGNQCVATG